MSSEQKNSDSPGHDNEKPEMEIVNNIEKSPRAEAQPEQTPLNSQFTRMIEEAEKRKVAEPIITIVSFLKEERPVFTRPKGKEAEADAAHKNFEFDGSDFLTLYNVWHAYEKARGGAGFNEKKWMHDNFLRDDILKEVEKMRETLMQGRVTEEKAPLDETALEEAQKCIVSAFIDNLVMNPSLVGHDYYSSQSGDKGFFIHPSSALFSNPPVILTAAHIVPKFGQLHNYLKTCQEVKLRWLEEIAPQKVKIEKRETVYDQSKDTFIQIAEVEFEKRNFTNKAYKPWHRPARIEEALTGEKATQEIAQRLTKGGFAFPFAENNQAAITSTNDILRRGGKEPLPRDFLVRYYTEKLGGISSVQEMKKAIKEGEINLLLNQDEVIPPGEKEKILAENPDFIIIEKAQYPVEYEQNRALIRMSAAEALRLTEYPSLPSGKNLTLFIEGRSYGYGREDINSVQDEVRTQNLISYLSGRIQEEQIEPLKEFFPKNILAIAEIINKEKIIAGDIDSLLVKDTSDEEGLEAQDDDPERKIYKLEGESLLSTGAVINASQSYVIIENEEYYGRGENVTEVSVTILIPSSKEASPK